MSPATMNVLNAALWIGIVLIAFLMQVLPFVLVVTLVMISFGLNSALALILIPASLFAMLVAACCYASSRMRRKLPAPLPVYRTDENPQDLTPVAFMARERRYHLR